MTTVEPYKPKNHVRIVTATSLFDGHDAAINIMRRILQDSGAEVIHLGHNRSAEEIVNAAVQEDVQAIAASSYQGGHMEFFQYMIDLLKQRGAPHIKVFGGGGGVIVPREIEQIEAMGVAKIFSPEDGRRLGLQGMINLLLQTADFSLDNDRVPELAPQLNPANSRVIASYITAIEEAKARSNGGSLASASLARREASDCMPSRWGSTSGTARKPSLLIECRVVAAKAAAIACCIRSVNAVRCSGVPSLNLPAVMSPLQPET